MSDPQIDLEARVDRIEDELAALTRALEALRETLRTVERRLVEGSVT